MTNIPYMGVTITLDSYQHDDLPGIWWPHATLHKMPSGEELEPVVHHEHCGSKADADSVALRIARRRIRDELHQG